MNIKRWVFLLLLFSFAFLIRLYQINAEHGFSDETVYAGLGKVYFQHFLSFGTSFWKIGSEHPPIAKYLYGMTESIFPEGHYLGARVFSALLGSLSCLLTILVAEYFLSFEISFLSGVILSLLPYFIAHNRIAGLETPSVFFSLLVIWSLLIYRQGNQLSYYLLSAISFAFLLGTRLNNGLLLIPIVFLFWFMTNSSDSLFTSTKLDLNTQKSILIVSYFVISAIVFYLVWPKLWFHPFQGITQSYFISEPVESIYKYFLGQKEYSPWYYFFIYLLVTTPGLLLLPLGWGLWESNKRLKKEEYFFLLLLFLSPFLLTFSQFRREGIRYVITCYPAMAIFCAIGVNSIYEKLKTKWQIGYNLVSIICIFYLVLIYLLIHPYELEYYNEWVGGTGNVYKHKWFQVGYWGNGITQGIEMVDGLPGKPVTLDIRMKPFHEMPMPSRKDLIIQRTPTAEYVIMNTEYEWYYLNPDELQGYSLYTSYTVWGVPIIKIYRNDSLAGKPNIPLDSSDWSAESNFQQGWTKFALDRDLRTRWSSLHAQEPGMYFQVDMNTTARVSEIGLVTWTTPSAYPVGYEVQVSEDGEKWVKVAENPKTPITDMVLEIHFQPVQARYIKIIETGKSPLFGWAIHEFYFYPVRPS